jgi:NADPH:quinone reductase-like Zn-dependent oxidoreductase
MPAYAGKYLVGVGRRSAESLSAAISNRLECCPFQKMHPFLTWATNSDYTASREDLLWHARDVLGWAADKTLQVHIAQTLPLADAAQAHQLLESRRVAGKLILQP